MTKLSLFQKLKIQIQDYVEKGIEIGEETKKKLLKEKEYHGDDSKNLQNSSRGSSS